MATSLTFKVPQDLTLPLASGVLMEPFLKWAGGKRWLANRGILTIDPKSRWVEPFAGGGAMFFGIEPRSAILGDANWDLINTYRAIRDNLDLFLEALNNLKHRTSSEDYYEIRSKVPKCDIRKAARFVYLNRLAWNGLYRVNKKGEFNVPRGSKNSVFLPGDDWLKVSRLLNNADLVHGDFEKLIDTCGQGDTIFVDPPYTVAHNNNGFLKYNETIFSWQDQVRLKEAVKLATKRGATAIVTNADHSSVHELYEGEEIERLSRSSVIAGNSGARGTTTEALITIAPSRVEDQASGL